MGSDITGIPAETIRRLAHEMGITARDEKIELPIPWTDAWGKEHETVTGNPVAFHAMRGLAAHSNGFQTIRAMSILMSILGTIDRPGGFRHKAPFPRPIPPCAKPPNGPRAVQPNTPLDGMPLGWPADPDDLFVDDEGSPVRIDKAFSWEYPLSVHGLMHNVITNAWRGDPYKIDTLMIFMANMAWNSSMNTSEVRNMLNDKDEDGEYKIPFLIVADAFQSETVAYADLVLPDTTYLERHDCMSMLDRPISEYDGPVDSVRIPVVPPKGECKPFQDVIIELGSRLKLPAFTKPDGSRKFRDYPDFVINYETAPGSGIGFLAGWRGKGGEKVHEGRAQSQAVGDVREKQLRVPLRIAQVLPVHAQLEPGLPGMGQAPCADALYRADQHPHLFRGVAEVPPRRTGQVGRQAAARSSARTGGNTFRSTAVLFAATGSAAIGSAQISAQRDHPAADGDVPLLGFAECLAAADSYLQLPERESKTAREAGIEDGGWMWVESMHGKVRCLCRYSEAVEPGTVWTWNAIGKASGAWGLDGDANEAQAGFPAQPPDQRGTAAARR